MRLDGLKATDPIVLKALSAITDNLRSISNVKAVHSLLTPLRSLEVILRIDDAEAFRSNPVAVESGMQLMEQIDKDTIRGFVSADRDLLRVYAQVGSTDFIDVARLGERIKEAAQSSIAYDSRIDIQATGTMYLVGRSVQRIIYSQWRGNWLCIAVITLIMAIALGIAVDDTIHFLHRYRRQLESGLNPQEALESTFRFTGRAIVQSALILCAGLCPCALSGYLGVRMIGTLLVFTLACGLIADLLLVPALIEMGLIRWKKS